ncbi:MAG: glycogen synthase GlgA [Verrucomicrobiia bacterium]
MNILFAASELSPYLKTGGLGDVMASLPQALRDRGHSISITLPLYTALRSHLPSLTPSKVYLRVPFNGTILPGRVWIGTTHHGLRIFALERDEFFDRSQPYGTADGDYFDNASRFGWFSRALIELLPYIDPTPEILHLNDWQTGPAALWARQLRRRPQTIFTIHNLAYQGVFPPDAVAPTGLLDHGFTPEGHEFYGRVNFLKAGLVFSDRITTVSPSYATAIQTPAFGCGLDGLLRTRAHHLTGILNGIDTATWDPSTNPLLAQTYSPQDLSGKTACKHDLLAACGWTDRPHAPIFGSVSRLVASKGFDLILAASPHLRQHGARLVILGTGEPRLEEAFRDLARRFPDDIVARIEFSETWAHRIEAGSDFFLMPSEMEPCGLNQMYSQRYGTPPIVHQAGGLADSVEPWNPKTATGTGFAFKPFQTGAFLTEIDRALSLYQKPKQLAQLRKNAMTRDFSWNARVPDYEALYSSLLIG